MALEDPIDEEEVVAPKKKGKPILMIAVIVLSVILLLGMAVGGTLYFSGAFSGEVSEDEPKKGKKDKDTKSGKSEDEMVAAPIYYPFELPFVVNFVTNSQVRYMQVTIEVMARDQAVIDSVKEHTPLIRNNIIMILSDADFETVITSSGKQMLRDQTLAEVRKIIKSATGEPGVEALYFTGFVIQ